MGRAEVGQKKKVKRLVLQQDSSSSGGGLVLMGTWVSVGYWWYRCLCCRDLVKSATKEALIAIGAEIRKGYESEAGRLTTQVADVDGHLGLLHSDFFNFKSALSGREEKLQALVGSAVDNVKAAAEEVRSSGKATPGATDEPADETPASQFETGVQQQLAQLQQTLNSLVNTSVQVARDQQQPYQYPYQPQLVSPMPPLFPPEELQRNLHVEGQVPLVGIGDYYQNTTNSQPTTSTSHLGGTMAEAMGTLSERVPPVLGRNVLQMYEQYAGRPLSAATETVGGDPIGEAMQALQAVEGLSSMQAHGGVVV